MTVALRLAECGATFATRQRLVASQVELAWSGGVAAGSALLIALVTLTPLPLPR